LPCVVTNFVYYRTAPAFVLGKALMEQGMPSSRI